MHNFEKILSRIVFTGICATFLMPFFIAPVLYPYSFDKALFFQIIIEMIFPVWIILAVFYPKYRPKFNILTVSISVFFGILFIAGLFGYDFQRSFWGYEERMNGIFTLLHFFIFYLIISSFFAEESKKRFILLWALGISAIISLFGIAQHYFISVQEFLGNDGRSVSLLGSPIVFAAYVLPHLFLSFYLLNHYWKNKIPRYFIICSSFVFLFAIYFSGTRGAMLGAMAGIFIAVLFVIVNKFLSDKNKQKIFFSSVLVLGFVALIFASLFGNEIAGFVPNSISKKIIVGTGETRLMLWNIAMRGFAEHPLLGWGPENFDLIYDKYYNPKFLDFSLYETWSDRAHNIILDILSTSGIFGFAAYIFIFGSAFCLILRKEINFGNIAIIGGLVAYFTQNLFAFDSPPSLLGFFMLLALVSRKEKMDIINRESEKSLKLAVCGIFVCVSISSLIFFNIRPAIASNFALKSMDTFGINPVIGYEYFKKSQKIWSPYRDAARVKFANAVYFAANDEILSFGQKIEFISLAIDEILKSSASHPYDFSYYFLLGNLYAAKGDFAKSYSYYEKAKQSSPARQAIFFQYASARFLNKENDEAIEILEQAVELNGNVRMPHWRLGLGLIGKDDRRAISEAVKAIELGYHPQNFEEINAFASIFMQEKKWNELVGYYELLVKSVETAEIYAQLAVAYAQKGDTDKARLAALKAAELNSEFRAEAELFIKLLEKNK